MSAHLLVLAQLFAAGNMSRAGLLVVPNAIEPADAPALRQCIRDGLVQLTDERHGLRANGRIAAPRATTLTLTAAGMDALSRASCMHGPMCRCGGDIAPLVHDDLQAATPTLAARGRVSFGTLGPLDCVICTRRLAAHTPEMRRSCERELARTNSDETIASCVAENRHGFGPPAPMPTRPATLVTVICGKCEHEWSGPADGECPRCTNDVEDHVIRAHVADVAGPDVGGSPGSRTARGTVLVFVDGQPITMTTRGWDLICAIADDKVFHISGGTVAVARKLADNALVRLQDDGPGPLDRGRVDGERWSVTLTALGECVASARKAVAS